MTMRNIIPSWQVKPSVKGFTTTRLGGVSLPPFDSFNLGDHVGDDKRAVEINRSLLVKENQLPQYPLFLNQTHSIDVVELPYNEPTANADAIYTRQPHQVCLVMTADCLPVLFTNQAGNEVAAAHAGWRGLCDGILEQTVPKFQCSPSEIIAWLGPCISQKAFQVGQEVVDQFISQDLQAESAFIPDKSAVNSDKYLCNLYLIARQRLNRLGVRNIYGGEYCTATQAKRFFSYRRDGKTGRMASLVWFE